MKKTGKIMFLLMILAAFVLGMNMQIYAAQAINSVSLRVSNEFRVGEVRSTDDVTITTSSERYYVEHVEILNEIREWGSTDIPLVAVFLRADDDYYFAVPKSNIKINGATLQRGRKGDDSDSIVLTLRLPALTVQTGEVEHAEWTSGVTGSWSEAYNAGYYELNLYRDGKSAGKVEKVEGTEYDFGSMMRRVGTYSFKVRAVNVRDESIKSPWKEAEGTLTVDAATSEQLQEQHGRLELSGLSEPGLAQKEEQYGWIQDRVGWWYRNADGSYTTSNWQYIDEKWYYFNSVGYMVTGWIDWNEKTYYCNPGSGEMLTSTIVPDGSGRRVDSTGAWIQ